MEYNKVLRQEAHIEKHVIQRMEQNGGVFISPDAVIGRRVFFAIDNIDFSEDTPDGKGTLHGTVMAIYQKKDPKDAAPKLRFTFHQKHFGATIIIIGVQDRGRDGYL